MGAAADTIVGVLILILSRIGKTEFTYPVGLVASLMFGWTLLLVWDAWNPVEHKAVLLLTIFPAIMGSMVSEVYRAATGALPLRRIIPTMAVGGDLIALMGFIHFNARALSRE